MRTGPCEWPLLSDLSSFPALTDEEIPVEIRQAAEDLAVGLLWRWTDRRFGVCDVTVRPCRADKIAAGTTWHGYGGAPPRDLTAYQGGGFGWPLFVDGWWHSGACRDCGVRCSCRGPSELRLPGPIDSVTEILIDGDPLDSTAWLVYDRRWLVRADGGRWPTGQDLDKPDSEPGTWSVRYGRGVDVPPDGRLAATVLANEIAKGASGKPCALPARVTNVTREGVTVAVLDGMEDLGEGRTGLFVVDAWLESIRGPRRPASVSSPDVRGRRGHRLPT